MAILKSSCDLLLKAGVLAINALGFAQASAAAHPYPDHPVHLVVPYPVGGGADHWGRLLAAGLAERLGQPIIVDNVPRKGGNEGTALVAHAPPDGYTLLLGSIGPLVVHRYTYTSLPFDPERDFVPIALLESSPMLLVAAASVPVVSARELIDLARARPGSLSYASNGIGSPEEVAGELFKARLNIDLHHIPYDGAGPARKAVLAGQAGLMFDPCKGAMPGIRSGLQNPLAVAAANRLASLPRVPTFAEVGVTDYELRIWTGLLAPAGTPPAIVSRLNRMIQEVLRSDDIKTEIAEEGGEVGATTPESFAAFIESERRRWSALVRESGVPRVDVRAGALVDFRSELRPDTPWHPQ
ncbi:MAG TPA: tripartite tricarboxylate transporter substrate binding protein [Steroidobacteraceae bacterium]|nr:tripartite tricarboxylate transporter substrate binding protein [Steroidobacteraceae bacterium]